MSNFLELKNTYVNIGKIREISTAGNSAVRITFEEDTTGIYDVYGDSRYTLECLQKTIIQVMPCIVPMYNVFNNGDGSYSHERLCYLALCSDGMIRSLAQCGGYFDLAEEASNFVGYFDEYMSKDYPKHINEVFHDEQDEN